MGTRSPSWAPGLIDRGRQRVRGIAFGGLTFKASQITNLWLEEWRHAARPQAQGRKSSFGKRGRSGAPSRRLCEAGMSSASRNRQPMRLPQRYVWALVCIVAPIHRSIGKLFGRTRTKVRWTIKDLFSGLRSGAGRIRRGCRPRRP